MILTQISDNGDTLQFDAKKFEPLGYPELISVAKNQSTTFDLKIHADKLWITPKNSKTEIKTNGRIDLPITFDKGLPIFAIVNSGWLPPPFVKPANLLVDRNVISNIKKLTNDASISSTDFYWWSMILKTAPDVLINPILFALEGNQRRSPTLEEFVNSYEEAVLLVRDTLPNANIVIHNDESYSKVHGLIEEHRNRRDSETEFLMRAAPILFDRVPKVELKSFESQICNIATDLSIGCTSLVFIAAISCLYYRNDPYTFPVARKLIKPKMDYSVADAYNTLADLSAIEMYIGSQALTNSHNWNSFAFCTCDKAVALFACGLAFSKSEYIDGIVNSSLSISEYLFPSLDLEERVELNERIFTNTKSVRD